MGKKKKEAEIETRVKIHPTHEPSISAGELSATFEEKVKLAEIGTHSMNTPPLLPSISVRSMPVGTTMQDGHSRRSHCRSPLWFCEGA